MPYKIKNNCVYKLGDEKPLKCYDTHEKALAYLRALEANVPDAHKELEEKAIQRPTQDEAAYTTVSQNPQQLCANCRWFNGEDNYCGIVENYPEDILPTGYCNRWEAKPNAPMNAMPEMPEMESEGGMMEMSLHEHEEPETAYIAPDSNADGIFKALTDKIKRGLKPGLSVFKGTDGSRYMLVVTSNSYQDREGETITTAALSADVDKAWDSVEGRYATDNKLLYWHDDRVEIGDIVWADVRGPFLVELAKENTAPLSKVIFDYRETHPDEKWGASHRFAYMKAHKDTEKTYHRIHKRETSILPREAAANALTFSGVIPMASKRDEYLNKMLGLENGAELLDKGIEVLVSELQKQGIEHKSADDKPADMSVYGNLLTDIIKSQAEMAEELDAVQPLVEQVKSLSDDNAKLIAANKELTERLDVIEKARPRIASRTTETEIEPDKIADDVRKSLAKRDPFFKAEVRE